MNPNNIISKLKRHHEVYTDDALAKALSVTQSAIAQWKTRGVPKRILVEYSAILSNEDIYTDEIPNEILRKYNIKITGTGEKGKKTDIPIEQGDSPVDANYIIELQKDKIEYLQKELAEKNALIKHKPKERPETLDEVSDMLHDASERWNWVFYKTDKPMSCTRKGIFRNVNPALCKLLGYSEDEMLGKSLLEFIHPDDHKRAVIEMKKSTRDVKLRICKSNGKYCNMNIEAQEFGTNGNTFSIGLITCCDEGCPDL